MALRIAQDINNLAGKVSAQQQLTVQGQTEGSRTGNINNADGQWLAGEGLTITLRDSITPRAVCSTVSGS